MTEDEKLIERTKGHRFQPGKSGNPGGQPKTKKELRLLAREGLPLAFRRAVQILEDEDAEWRAWLEAGKFLALYGYGPPPKVDKDEDSERERARVTSEVLEQIARMRKSTEQPDGSAEH